MRSKPRLPATVVSNLPAEAVPSSRVRELLDAFFGGRNPATLRAYQQALGDFQRFLEEGLRQDCPTVNDAVRLLLGRGHGAANHLALRYRNHLTDSGKAPSTVNQRLAALRSAVKMARTLGMVPWSLEVPNVERETYRDTRGPGEAALVQLLDEADRRVDEKGRRDRAILYLMAIQGLRRVEVSRLDVGDVDLDRLVIWIHGKKRSQKQARTITETEAEALKDWLEVRGKKAGPLFVNFDRAGKGKRLTGRSIGRIVEDLGLRAGLGKVRAHGLRHTAISGVLDENKGDLRAAQRFSRHKDPRTLMVYDDNREDVAGEMAKLWAARLMRKRSRS